MYNVNQKRYESHSLSYPLFLSAIFSLLLYVLTFPRILCNMFPSYFFVQRGCE